MTDIVERLRENILADAFKDKVINSGKLTERLIYERRDAVAEIERLRGAINLAKAILSQGGSITTLVAANGPTIESVIDAALHKRDGEADG